MQSKIVKLSEYSDMELSEAWSSSELCWTESPEVTPWVLFLYAVWLVQKICVILSTNQVQSLVTCSQRLLQFMYFLGVLSVASSDIYSLFRSAVVLPLALVECQSAKLHSKSNKNICKSLPTILIRNYFVKMA